VCGHGHLDVVGTEEPLLQRDMDVSTPALEPDCIVEEELRDGSTSHVAECLRGEDGYLIDPETNDYQLPPGVDICHAKLTDGWQSTPSVVDDISCECSDQNMNLEFKISRRPGHPAASGTRVTATCSLAEYPELECPNLRE
jgi:hypothetical protein